VARTDNELRGNWEHALLRVFPNGIPVQASWTETDEIARVLSAIGAPNTGHMFFPGGGGEDLTGAAPSQAGLIELHSGDWKAGAYVVQAASLEFSCPFGQTLAAHFMLHLSPISRQPRFSSSSDEYQEEFGEAGGRTYSFEEYTASIDRNGNDLPANTRRIVRYWGGGKIAVFAKASPYNDQHVTNRAFGFDAYDGYHMDAQKFDVVVQKLAEALNR